MKRLRVASVQFQHAPGDKRSNLATMRRFIELAAAQEVRLICFPECCVSGYWHLRHLSREELTALAEPIPQGAITQQLLEWARQFEMTIGAGFVERSDEGSLYNAYVVATSDGEWVRHRKLHCFISAHMDSGD